MRRDQLSEEPDGIVEERPSAREEMGVGRRGFEVYEHGGDAEHGEGAERDEEVEGLVVYEPVTEGALRRERVRVVFDLLGREFRIGQRGARVVHGGGGAAGA